MRKVLFWAVVACAVAAPAVAASPHAAAPRGGAPAAPDVHVSGKWAIVVRDRAGHVRRRVHFENSLLSTNPLGQILSGWYTPSGQWRLSFFVSGSSRINVPATVTADGTTTVLAAQTTATASGTMGSVLSELYLCGQSTAPAACAGSGYYYDFTADGGLSVPIHTGDTISAVVRLSFSVPATFAVNATAAEMFMAQVIRGELTVGAWGIDLAGPSGRLPDELSVKWDYHIGDLILTAQDVSTVDATISSVQADQYTCAPTVSPVACAAPGAATKKLELFRHQLSAGNQVVLGQQVTVRWMVTFS